jgi:hypothetical protein
MFGYRADGRRIRGMDPIVNLTPYIMPRRYDAQVQIRHNLDFDVMTRYIREKREQGFNVTYMGLLLAAYVRTVSQYPELNRFIMNKQLYARNHICVSFVTLKKGDDPGKIEESLVKLAFAPDETVFLSPEGFRGMHALIWSPLSDADGLDLGERARRDTLAVVVASYEFHGGFRLRTLTA